MGCAEVNWPPFSLLVFESSQRKTARVGRLGAEEATRKM